MKFRVILRRKFNQALMDTSITLDQVLVCEKGLIRYKQYEYKDKPVK